MGVEWADPRAELQPPPQLCWLPRPGRCRGEVSGASRVPRPPAAGVRSWTGARGQAEAAGSGRPRGRALQRPGLGLGMEGPGDHRSLSPASVAADATLGSRTLRSLGWGCGPLSTDEDPEPRENGFAHRPVLWAGDGRGSAPPPCQQCRGGAGQPSRGAHGAPGIPAGPVSTSRVALGEQLCGVRSSGGRTRLRAARDQEPGSRDSADVRLDPERGVGMTFSASAGVAGLRAGRPHGARPAREAPELRVSLSHTHDFSDASARHNSGRQATQPHATEANRRAVLSEGTWPGVARACSLFKATSCGSGPERQRDPLRSWGGARGRGEGGAACPRHGTVTAKQTSPTCGFAQSGTVSAVTQACGTVHVFPAAVTRSLVQSPGARAGPGAREGWTTAQPFPRPRLEVTRHPPWSVTAPRPGSRVQGETSPCWGRGEVTLWGCGLPQRAGDLSPGPGSSLTLRVAGRRGPAGTGLWRPPQIPIVTQAAPRAPSCPRGPGPVTWPPPPRPLPVSSVAPHRWPSRPPLQQSQYSRRGH